MGKLRLAFDTNLWVSFAIGKRLAHLPAVLLHPRVEVYSCPELLAEVTAVLLRPKLQRYLTPARVQETLDLILARTRQVVLSQHVTRSRDAADDYLLALAQEYRLDYLVTGDLDLLTLQTHAQTRIVTFAEAVARVADKPFK